MVPEASMRCRLNSLAILGYAELTFCWKESGLASKVSMALPRLSWRVRRAWSERVRMKPWSG